MELSKLKEPFKPEQISWRVGPTTSDKSRGQALCYIDARDVQDRLDEICGTMGWQNRFVPMHDKKTVCEIGIYSEALSQWIWKSDGAGDSDVEAEKGALSDSFKRCAVKWGIGRYLYDLDSPWVELEPAGRSYKIAAKEYARLEGILNRSKPLPTYGVQGEALPVNPGKQMQNHNPQPIAKDWKVWGNKVLDTARKAPLEKLDSLLDKNAGDLVKLRAQEPVLHGDIIRLVQSRQELGK